MLELWLILHFACKSYFACPYRCAQKLLQKLFHCPGKIYSVWVQQNKICPNRTIFDRLAAVQSCPKTPFFVKMIKICQSWAPLESYRLVKYCPIWTNFILLNSHKVDLPRAIKHILQKFPGAPVRTRKIWFACQVQN